MGKGFQRSNFTLCGLGFELPMQIRYVVDYAVLVELATGKFHKLKQIGSVCFGGLGTEGSLFRAIAEVCIYIIS